MISSPYFIPSENLLHTIRRVALSGVKVTLIIPGIPDKKVVYKVGESFFNKLLECGVNIYRYKPGFNHQKTILVDNKIAFVGSINMDIRSLVHHFECGAILYQTPCLLDIKNDFNEMIEVSEKVSPEFKLPKRQILLCALICFLSSLRT